MMRAVNAMVIDFKSDGESGSRAEFSYHVTPAPTQDAAIEKAGKLEPDAAIHVERVRNVEGGGRDRWRRI
jgi:hypothetical protein